MGYCMRPLRKGFIIRALNLLQLRKLANIRLSWAVSDCMGHIFFHETSVHDWWLKENLCLVKRGCPYLVPNKSWFNFVRVKNLEMRNKQKLGHPIGCKWYDFIILILPSTSGWSSAIY